MNSTPQSAMSDLRLLTLNELAKEFNVRKGTIQEWIVTGGVLGMMVGTRKKYVLRDVVEAIRKRQEIENKAFLDSVNRALAR